MHPRLRQFLEANGLRADANDAQAWEYYKQLQADGIAYNGPERAEPADPPSAPSAEPPPAPAGGAGLAREQADAVNRAIQAERERTAAIEDMAYTAKPSELRSA